MGWWSKARDAVIAYNPITMATDVVTGGKVSEALGVEGVVSQAQDIAGKVESISEDISGKTAEEAARRASATEASAMLEQLDYLKEINKLPQQYREQALAEMSQRLQPGGTPTQAERIGLAKESPIYAEIMGARGSGEEAILRGAGATGGLRSGNVQEALYDYNVGLKNTALTQAYNQQQAEEDRRLNELRSLAGLDTGTTQIAQTMGDIGGVRAAGITAGAQARTQGTANLMNLGLGAASLFI
jgi:hypothetical protein